MTSGFGFHSVTLKQQLLCLSDPVMSSQLIDFSESSTFASQMDCKTAPNKPVVLFSEMMINPYIEDRKWSFTTVQKNMNLLITTVL